MPIFYMREANAWMQNVDREGRKDIAGAKISLLAVRDWCVQRRVNLSKFCKELSKLGILLSRGERITLGKGTTVGSSRRTLSGLRFRSLGRTTLSRRC